MAKRGRNKNFSRIKQEKKAIATRLIQISLVMDDYVYKNKDITVAEAEKYIQEITSYKNKCVNDPRSLQVIEKLLKCMKSIINTHKDTQNKCGLSNSKEIICQAVCPSPAYSLPDEDKEYLSQSNIKHHNTDLMQTDEYVEVIDSYNEIEELDQNEKNKELYKTGNEFTPSQETNIIAERLSQERNTKHLDDNKGTAIEDEDVTNISAISPPSNNSQSILNNIQDSENQDFITTPSQVAQIPDVNSCKNKNQLLVTTPLYDIFTEIDYSQSILSNSVNIKNEEFVGSQTGYAGNKMNNSQNINSQSKDIANETMISSVSEFQKEKYATDRANHDKNISETNYQELITLPQSKISDLSDKNIPAYYIMKPVANNIHTNTEIKPKKKRAPRRKKIDETSQETSKSKDTKRKPRKNKDSTKANIGKGQKLDSQITSDGNNNRSENSENSLDLSWIENLRYVRQISATESHTRSKDLSLSFWENYSLPNDWDDSEFMYDE